MKLCNIALMSALLMLSLPGQAKTGANDTADTAESETRPTPAEFARYPAAPSYHGKPAQPVLDSRDKRRFRTYLRNGSKEPANFNGHHRLVRWGCGTNCIGWAIVNKRNGQVWMGDKSASSCWPFKREEQENEEFIPDWFEISVKSRMFYAYVCDDDSGYYTFNKRKVYLWQNGQPKLLRIDSVNF